MNAPRAPTPRPLPTSRAASSRVSGSSGIRTVIGWSVAGGQSRSASSRCAVMISKGRSTSDLAIRCSSFDDEHVGPLQIVDPQHHRTRPRASTEPFDDQREQDLAGLRGRDMVELGGVPEQVHDAFDESTEHRIIGLEAVQLDALGPADLPQQIRWSVLVQFEPTEQRRRDRRPHVGLAVRGTRSREDGDGTTRERVERFGDQPGLAGSGFTGDRHDRTATVGDHRHDRRQELPLRRPPDERHVVEPGADGRARDADDR